MPPIARFAVRFALGAGLFVAFVQAGTVALVWWRGELTQPTLGDWLWVLSLPLLIGAYLRWFSVFRPGCDACAADPAERPPGPRGP